MPKIINPDSISIESLTVKLNGLESKFTALEKKHSILQDSVQSLNQTILKADIATSFYDAHLATYTTIFTVIVAIVAASLAAYNIFAIYKPIQFELKELREIIFPKYITDLKKENEDQIKELKVVNDKLKDAASDGIIWGLKAMMSHYELSKSYSSVILFSMRYIEHLIDFEDIKLNMVNIKIYLDYIDSLIELHNIRMSDIEGYDEEINLIFKKIIKLHDDEFTALCLKCRKDLYSDKVQQINDNTVNTKNTLPK
ncbi:hypothetical protein [Sphingobacterium anhuiense]|uniref:hypothetical protein n=1 Tax=Sphingobacterium anhuiense TaxID=493780 RepID=UPI003C2F1826